MVEDAALAVAGFAVLAGLLALLSTGRVRSALPVALDFLTAAGLLRLSAQQDWQALAGAAAVVVLRHLVVWALDRRTSPVPPGRGRDGREDGWRPTPGRLAVQGDGNGRGKGHPARRGE